MRKKQSKNMRNMPEEDLNSSRDACLNEGVMLWFIHFFLILSYLGISAHTWLPALGHTTLAFLLRHKVTDRWNKQLT